MKSSLPTGRRGIVERIIDRILELSDPVGVTREKVASLLDDGDIFRDHIGPVTMIAVGKAALHMARGALEGIDGKISVEGVVVAPEDTLSSETGSEIRTICNARGLEVVGAQHPYPGSCSFRAGRRVLEMVGNCRGLCIFLLSGGASSLMEYPIEGFPEDDMIYLNRELVRSGASIHDINIVRKHASRIKGGRLAQSFNGRRMITLAISDVMGSDPATIGSGPTVLDTPDSTVDRCRRILEKYKLLDCLSAEGRDILISPDHDLETPKSIPDGERFEYHIILSNELLLKRMKKELAAQYPSLTVPGVAALSAAGKESISVEQMGEELLRVGRKFISEKKVSGNDGPGDCLLYITGGEPTVRVEGKGTGGRTQHVALLFLQGLLCDPALAGRMGDITLVAFATDGKDGNSPAAGCIVDRELFDVFLGRSGRDNGATNHRMSEEVERHIREFDSHSFFEKYDSLITTGPTGTNVMDIYIVSIKATKS